MSKEDSEWIDEHTACVCEYTPASGGPCCDCGYKKKGRETMLKTTLKIDGMMCSMCEAHICDVIRKTVPGAKKVAASHRSGEASFLSEVPADESKLKNAIAATGYGCLTVDSAPYKKKGWFGW